MRPERASALALLVALGATAAGCSCDGASDAGSDARMDGAADAGSDADSGGETDAGGPCVPAPDTWCPISLEGAPAARWGSAAIWDGAELVIWGGTHIDDLGNAAPLLDGGRYDPITDTWAPLAQSPLTPRFWPVGVWTGAEVIIWGGWEADSTGNTIWLNDGARYDPTTETWAPMSLAGAPAGEAGFVLHWTGQEVIAPGSNYWDGGAWDPMLDQWRPIVVPPAPPSVVSSVWTGTEMLYWGIDFGDFLGAPLPAGERWDPVSDTWSPMSAVGAPPPRYSAVTVWAADRMIIWGGLPADFTTSALEDGGRYDPVGDEWSPMASEGGPGVRGGIAVLSTGTEVIVWGGSRPMLGTPTGSEFLSDGRRYDPVLDTWTPMTDTRAPEPRSAPRLAVWTGQAMLIWGGYRDGLPVGTGGRYYP